MLRLGSSRVPLILTLLGAAAGSAWAQSRAAIVADHRAAGERDATVPLDALQKAQDLRVVLAHQSVGFDVIRGLRLLSESQPDRYRLAVQPRIDPWWFSRNAGLGEFFLGSNGDAIGKIDQFERRIRDGLGDRVDVAAMKLCYADMIERSDPEAIFVRWRDSYDRLERDYPDVAFVWWTCPLPQPSRCGDKRTAINDRIRAHVRERGGVLLDVADIECHDPSGQESRHPDGSQRLVEAYARDQGGHLNDEGAVRVGRAWWWLMARIAGWGGR